MNFCYHLSNWINGFLNDVFFNDLFGWLATWCDFNCTLKSRHPNNFDIPTYTTNCKPNPMFKQFCIHNFSQSVPFSSRRINKSSVKHWKKHFPLQFGNKKSFHQYSDIQFIETFILLTLYLQQRHKQIWIKYFLVFYMEICFIDNFVVLKTK